MKNWLLLTILVILLTGCQSVQGIFNNNELMNWKYGDLRLLDPIDAQEPEQDVIALYTRIIAQSFQIRIDFLDLGTASGKDIYIAIDTNPGGLTQIKVNKNDSVPVEISWDYLIKIPRSGNVVIVDDQLAPVYGMALLIMRDITQDRIVISFNKDTIPISIGKTKLQVIITPYNQSIVNDKSDPFSIDAPSPARVKVLFAFWNTFTAATPAQTLRSWAGAHAGPMSSRHGLKYLIDATAQTKSTVLLLDLLTPDNLAALDYLDAIPRIRKLTGQGILALPDIESNTHNYIDINKTWNIGGNIEVESLNRKSVIFLLMNSFYYLYNNKFVIGGYGYAKYENYINTCGLLASNLNSTDNILGLSLDCKNLLLSTAISTPTTLLILGGNFSNSILGDPSVSSEVFNYINYHPWIQILSIYDLITANNLQFVTPPPYSKGQSTSGENIQQSNLIHKSDSSSVQVRIYDSLLRSPENRITALAWQVFYLLTQPTTSDLLSLRSNYVGQIGQLLAAANWADNPSSIETCDRDLDYDGKNECVLANNKIFSILDPEGGYLSFVFSKDDRGIHQIIGPTWEFIVGLSDPSDWDLSLGLRSDYNQILGAFSDSFHDWNNYNVVLKDNYIIMESEKMTMRKSISVSPNSLHIEIRNFSQSVNNSFIPLVLDPWIRYTPGWGDLYTSIKLPFAFQWGINSGVAVEIRSTNPVTGFPFNASHASLAYPEDPNYDYSRSHYLPYPMALTEISSTENYFIDIIINP